MKVYTQAKREMFLEGCIALRENYVKTGKAMITKEIADKYGLRRAKKEYYAPVFDLSVELTMDVVNDILNSIRVGVLSIPEINESIAIKFLKSTGNYIIQKKVVTVTYEEV